MAKCAQNPILFDKSLLRNILYVPTFARLYHRLMLTKSGSTVNDLLFFIAQVLHQGTSQSTTSEGSLNND